MSEMSFLRNLILFFNYGNETEIFDLIDDSTKLFGSILLDVLKDGCSAVYSFFDVNFIKRGLGKNLIINNYFRIKKKKMPYLYLGYWVKRF